MTKKSKLEQYDAVASERDMLALYLFDAETGFDKPIVERCNDQFGRVTAKLYRPMGAMGGYVVLKIDDNVSIHQFERLYESYRTRYETSTLAIRTVLERLNVARKRMFDQAQNHGQAPEFVPVAAQRNL